MSSKFVTGLLLVLFASAAHANLEQVADNKVGDFTVAINQAMNNSKLVCDGVYSEYSGTHDNVDPSSFYKLSRSLWTIDSVQIDESGAQPLLVYVGNHSTGQRTQVTLTTSSDYKQVISAVVREQSFVNYNYGDLKNLDVRKVWMTDHTATCHSANSSAPNASVK